jgi:hypothetical protein
MIDSACKALAKLRALREQWVKIGDDLPCMFEPGTCPSTPPIAPDRLSPAGAGGVNVQELGRKQADYEIRKAARLADARGLTKISESVVVAVAGTNPVLVRANPLRRMFAIWVESGSVNLAQNPANIITGVPLGGATFFPTVMIDERTWGAHVQAQWFACNPFFGNCTILVWEEIYLTAPEGMEQWLDIDLNRLDFTPKPSPTSQPKYARLLPTESL